MKTPGKIITQQSSQEHCQRSVVEEFAVREQFYKDYLQESPTKNSIKQQQSPQDEYNYQHNSGNLKSREFLIKGIKSQQNHNYFDDNLRRNFNNNFLQNRLKMNSIKKNYPRNDKAENKQNIQTAKDIKLRRTYKQHQALDESEINRMKQIQLKYIKQQGNISLNSKTVFNYQNHQSNFNMQVDLLLKHKTDIQQSQVIQLIQKKATNFDTNIHELPLSNFVSKLKQQIKGTQYVRYMNSRNQQNHEKTINQLIAQQKSRFESFQNTTKLEPYLLSKKQQGCLFNQNITTMLQNFYSKSQQNSAKTSQNTSRIQPSQQVKQFVQKVDIVNDRIEGRIGLLQNKIKQLQIIKQKSRKLRNQKEVEERMQQNCRQIQLQQAANRQRSQIIQRIRGTVSIKQSHGQLKQKDRQNLNIVQSVLFQDSNLSSHRMKANQLDKDRQNPNIMVDNIPQAFLKKSTVNQQLIGKYKGQSKFPRQFTALVNRIKEQVEMDSQFTRIILNMDKALHEKVKTYLFLKYTDLHKSFIQINSFQLDPLNVPLQEKYPQFKTIQALGEWLYKIYIKIEKHFGCKLYRKYELNTVEILIEELENNYRSNLTVGHLASYLNMRTGCQFRNRHLIKLLKRMECEQTLQRQKIRNFISKRKLQPIKQ